MQSGELIPTDPWYIPYHVTSCSVYKEEVGDIQSDGLLKSLLYIWSPAFFGMAEHLPARGKG